MSVAMATTSYCTVESVVVVVVVLLQFCLQGGEVGVSKDRVNCLDTQTHTHAHTGSNKCL